MAFTCEAQDIAGGRLLRIDGQLDVTAVPELERDFLKITATRPGLVILDLSQMSFISSLGIGSLLNLHKGITRNGGNMRCVAPQPMVAEAFRRVRLYDVLDIRDTLESALESKPG